MKIVVSIDIDNPAFHDEKFGAKIKEVLEHVGSQIESSCDPRASYSPHIIRDLDGTNLGLVEWSDKPIKFGAGQSGSFEYVMREGRTRSVELIDNEDPFVEGLKAAKDGPINLTHSDEVGKPR